MSQCTATVRVTTYEPPMIVRRKLQVLAWKMLQYPAGSTGGGGGERELKKEENLRGQMILMKWRLAFYFLKNASERECSPKEYLEQNGILSLPLGGSSLRVW